MAKPAQPAGELLTVPEVAARAKVSPSSVRRAIARLEIAVTRLGGNVRITEAAFHDWIRRCTEGPVL